MLRNLAAGLFEHGQIETTMPKAKAVQPFVEKIITIAKKGTFASRRQIESRLTDRRIHAWVADPNVPDARKDNVYFDLPGEYGSLRVGADGKLYAVGHDEDDFPIVYRLAVNEAR